MSTRPIPLSSVLISPANRQRTTIDPEKLSRLILSIQTDGLLHPIIVRPDTTSSEPRYFLVAGERRFRALSHLFHSGASFTCGLISYDPIVGDIPALVLSEKAEWEAARIELSENIEREDLSWQDRNAAILRIEELIKAQNPLATATEISEALIARTAATAHNLKAEKMTIDSGRQMLLRAKTIARHADNPAVSNARNQNEAFLRALKEEEHGARAALQRRTVGGGPTSVSIRLADLFDELPILPSGQFDLILSDPPYGVGADESNYNTRAVAHHTYDDTPERARSILQTILMEGFRLTLPRATVFLFTDFTHFDFLCQTASAIGWTPFKTPLIWQKSLSEGYRPWGRMGPARLYNTVFYARKGQRGLVSPLGDVLFANRVGRADRVHAAEKPVGLLEEIIEAATLPGENVLDPCAGSGSTLIAARNKGRRALGLELDAKTTEIAQARLLSDDEPSDV